MDTYLFKIDWYDDYDDDDHTSYGAIGGESFADVAEKISKRFRNIDSILMRRLFCFDGFVFMEQDEWERRNKEEDEGI